MDRLDEFHFGKEMQVNKLLEEENDIAAAQILREAEWDEENQEVSIYQEEYENAVENSTLSYDWENHEGFGKLFIPLDLPFDGLRHIGRKSSEKIPPRNGESKIKGPLYKASAAGILYEFASDTIPGLDQLPDMPETLAWGAIGGFSGAHVLKGRLEAEQQDLKERKAEEYIDQLDDEKLDYNLQIYPS